jgi:signal peptidase I
MSSQPLTNADSATPANQYMRETVESIIVAFILAFLFRAFVAEAFVIPTGSMAPTLMGAHKDLTCNQCGSQYQVGASLEFQSDTGARTGNYVTGSTSSICRAVNPIDFQDPNQATFSGDRILVSKFDYVFSKPQRWDVLVFKFPEEARMNYIKRLVGLPGEDVMIREGDIYVKSHQQANWGIARKPPTKIMAMRQPVSDTGHPAPELIKRGYPSLWQPVTEQGQVTEQEQVTNQEQGNGWKVVQDEMQWSAELAASESPSWLRYFHRELSEEDWLAIDQNRPLPEVDPNSSQLVTDYLAYNSYFARDLRQPERYQPTIEQLVNQSRRTSRENGLHWVGDLIAEFEVEVLSSSGQLLLELVEFGIEYRLVIDVATGEVLLTAWDASQPERSLLEGYFNGDSDLVAPTKIRGKGNYRVAVANVDDQIVLWINGRIIKFDQPSFFDSWTVRSEDQRRPYWLPGRPLDAAPIGIGGTNLSMKIRRARVFRDLYYTAVQREMTEGFDASDFGNQRSILRARALPNSQASGLSDMEIVRKVYSNPKWWDQTGLFELRNRSIYRLEEGQYFPLGDNSAQSSDARMWNESFVSEEFLLGKALLVFWPHTWNRPIPFTPNFARMGLIR